MGRSVAFGLVVLNLFWMSVSSSAGECQVPVGESFTGTLLPDLAARRHPPFYGLDTVSASSKDREGVRNLVAGDRVFTAKMVPVDGVRYSAAMVERLGGGVEVLVDLNQDGVWTTDERLVLSPTGLTGFGPGVLEATFSVRLPTSYRYRTYPVVILITPIEQAATKATGPRHYLLQSSGVAAQGFVNIYGRRTSVQYASVDVRTGAVNPAKDWSGLDSNGDGSIGRDWLSPECARAEGRPTVFRIGDRYLSTERIDTTSGTIVLRSHPASDYTRIELTVGAVVPDFGFIDLSDVPRRLLDFHGKIPPAGLLGDLVCAVYREATRTEGCLRQVPRQGLRNPRHGP